MKPHIDSTSFGSISVNQKILDYDIVLCWKEDVKKRKKKLSKQIHGTSHILSREEAKHIYQKGTERVIIGSGQYGALKLSEEADQYFKKKECPVTLLPTPEAIEVWNTATGKVVGLFHVTC
ncbi:MAG: hypothetical protein KAT07_03575 [Calditrichia bacterium]|nr:hypothetical protein [Calditrichia bacterium]